MRFKIRQLAVAFILITSICVLSACGKSHNKGDKKIQVSNNKLLEFFGNEIPDADILLAKEEDLNGDGLKDIVVIYTHDNNNEMVVAINNENGDFKLSNSHKAPIENQSIQFKNIDDKDPIEFIISGSKNGAVGYGIYRLENDKVIDLFGEDMNDCC